jgi:hypothetical protein
MSNSEQSFDHSTADKSRGVEARASTAARDEYAPLYEAGAMDRMQRAQRMVEDALEEGDSADHYNTLRDLRDLFSDPEPLPNNSGASEAGGQETCEWSVTGGGSFRCVLPKGHDTLHQVLFADTEQFKTEHVIRCEDALDKIYEIAANVDPDASKRAAQMALETITDIASDFDAAERVGKPHALKASGEREQTGGTR